MDDVSLGLSLVIPIYNEAEQIEGNIRTVTEYLGGIGRSFEVILADDGSVDGTKEILRRIAAADRERIVLCENRTNRGKGSVLNLGLARARGDVVGFLDADLEIDVRFVGDLLDALEGAGGAGGVDVAVGSRSLTGGDAERSRLRHLAHFGYNVLIRLALGSTVCDNSSGIKLFRREVRDRVLARIEEAGWGWDVEFLVRCQIEGFRIREVPIRTVEQRLSKVRVFGAMLQTLGTIARLRGKGLRVRRRDAPGPGRPAGS